MLQLGLLVSFILFYNALSVEFQVAIRLDGYTTTNNSTLETLSF